MKPKKSIRRLEVGDTSERKGKAEGNRRDPAGAACRRSAVTGGGNYEQRIADEAQENNEAARGSDRGR
jgi:hypothetical protein